MTRGIKVKARGRSGVEVSVGAAVVVLTPEEARQLACEVCDAADEVDPQEEASEWERHAEEQAAPLVPALSNVPTPAGLAKAIHAAMPGQGLAVRQPSPHHFQVMRGSKVFAEWWPSRGTTRAAGQPGPKCRDVARLVAWLRSL